MAASRGHARTSKGGGSIPICAAPGLGRSLIAAIEEWARVRGFTELSSDTLLSNTLSRTVHPRLGFEPTEQIQYFRKEL
jgi:aminoglycoside 6'-N-acetyltransferase I